MKYASIKSCMDTALLRFIRDKNPTENELLDWLGSEQQGRYYFLRKIGFLALNNNHVVFSPLHLSPDGKCFTWKNTRYHLDQEIVETLKF